MKKLAIVLMVLVLALALAPAAMAAEEAGVDSANILYYALAALGCCLGIGLAALGTGIGMGHGIRGACEGVARNPGVSNKIMTTMIVGLALVESLAIYALVVVFIIIFVKPFGL